MAIELKDVEHLAGLARIAVSDNEKELFRSDLEDILAYVSKIKEVAGEQLTTDLPATAYRSTESSRRWQAGTATRTFDEMQGEIHNVMRADENPHEPGIFTEDLLVVAPSREGNRVFVKKIL